MAKKYFIVFALLLFAVLLFFLGKTIINSRFYLPDLPVEGITKKEAYEKISNRHNDIRYLINNDNFNWYIYQGSQETFGNEIIKQVNTLDGFTFLEQIGSGYVFESKKTGDKLIIESQMWTANYIIFKLPVEVRLSM
ncbi:hypothetical protein [Paenibacillus lautus]|uniref:hypothetical protein n=1 Tax=Paenibacillus lautus TaxID=1401 RepID=UPI001C7DE2C2|nr:hypothetical protein [Paenibacillus lautus]MBX4148693.1 hypothetical protein [Paenibacillus lautus]